MNMFKYLTRITILPILIFPILLLAEEKLEMEGTSIIGNKELPKVLYIVPWKSPDRIDIRTPAVSSILDRPLPTIDRGSFRRRIYYHQAIFTSSANGPR